METRSFLSNFGEFLQGHFVDYLPENWGIELSGKIIEIKCDSAKVYKKKIKKLSEGKK